MLDVVSNWLWIPKVIPRPFLAHLGPLFGNGYDWIPHYQSEPLFCAIVLKFQENGSSKMQAVRKILLS